MLLERMGGTVTLEHPDGTTEDVRHVLWYDADASDQTVMDVQTRFINQARYKGDSRTLTLLWPKRAPHDLMDCHVTVGGERFRVYADPHPPSGTPALNGYDLFVTATHSLFLYEATLYRTSEALDEWGVPTGEVDEGTVTPVNLLRLSEDESVTAGRVDLARIVLLELPTGTWDEADPYDSFAFDGHMHRITSVNRAGEQVVIGGRREVNDA
jgi:hypothetical protein